jgi:H+/Cl- antiporter ClcA
MGKMPCLIVGAVLGIIAGAFASEPPRYNHHTEAEILLRYRILYGAGVGLIVGLLVDLYVGYRRRR